MSRLISAFFCSFFVLFIFVSCASVHPRGTLAGATVVGKESDVFVFVPIGHNRTLLSRVLPQSKYIEKVLDRTNYLYASIKVKNKKPLLFDDVQETEEGVNTSSFDSSDATSTDSSMGGEGQDIFSLLSYDVCAVGKYPKSIAGFIFNKSNGWQKQKSISGYKYYKKVDRVDARGVPVFSFCAIPDSNLALFSYNEANECKMENLLERVDSPHPVRFGEEFELSIQQGENAKDICVYVANPQFFLASLLALDIDLPIDNLKVYLTRNTEKAKEFYNYKIILQMRNITAGFATRLLLSKLLKTQVRIEDNNIIVEKARVSVDRLVQIINKLLNRE